MIRRGVGVVPALYIYLIACRALYGSTTVERFTKRCERSATPCRALSYCWVAKQVPTRLEPDYELILQDIKASPEIAADETGWRVGGYPAWLHVGVADRATAYIIDPQRSAAVLERVIGSDWDGILSHDGFAVGQFASWLGLCPQFRKTGGKVQSSRTRKGKGRAAQAFRLAAWGLMRSKGYLGAYLRRQRSRLGAPKAITAAAHKLARIVYHLMRYGEAYVKKDEEAYAAQVRDRLEKQLRRRAKELGFEVVRVTTDPDPSDSPLSA